MTLSELDNAIAVARRAMAAKQKQIDAIEAEVRDLEHVIDGLINKRVALNDDIIAQKHGFENFDAINDTEAA